MTNVRILRWQDLDLRNDLESVLALISELDLIISVSTAVVPLAGAIGVPTLMLAHRNYFHLGESDIYPWFKSVIPVFPAASETVASCLPEAVEIMKKY